MSTIALALLDRLRAQGVVPVGISADSRRVGAGEVFAAWPGFSTDGRRYIGAAVERGAAAVLWESGDGFGVPDGGQIGVPSLPVRGLRDVAGYLADEIYGRPSAHLWLAGVTGTNGKTTVSQWLACALNELDVRCGVIGTLGSGFPGKLTDSNNTTPDALDLHRILAGFLADGGEAAAMEVSSIGLDQGRANGARFDVAIFTNLSRDHLDYHSSMETYAAAKARLFDAADVGEAVLNMDDEFGANLARRLAGAGMPVIAYTQGAAPAVAGARLLVAERVRGVASGMRFALRWEGREHDVQVNVVAPFNVSNLLAVIGALLARGVALEDALAVLPRLTPPPGRMQLVGGIGEPLVVIDYAHTPDALAKALEAVRETAHARGGRLVCVFGCGGGRDAGKRPLMGEAAGRSADRVVVTSDNPRGEDPAAIIEAVAAGVGAGAERIVDRAEAIRVAIGEAAADDLIVIAGKGHEPYQEIQGRRLPFSDLEQARAALLAWNRKGLTA